MKFEVVKGLGLKSSNLEKYFIKITVTKLRPLNYQ